MKNTLIVAALLSGAQILSAQSFIEAFSGVFEDGALDGFQIEGFIEIDTDSQVAGTADLSGVGPQIEFFEFLILNPNLAAPNNVFSEFLEFDSINDDALATFDTIAPATQAQVTTFDFLGTNIEGETLDFFYDAFADSPATAFAVSFNDGFGNISNATLDLPTAVPEPSAFALLLGAVALGLGATRRRR